MKKILYFPSENENSNHTSVEALFNKYLRKYFEIQVVYNSNQNKTLDDNNICIKDRRKLFLHENIMKDFDFFIVRNDFKVLKTALEYKKNHNKNFLVGFQSTFLHSYRRVIQSQIEKKSMLRKYIQYLIQSKVETKLLKECDFLIPNSKMMNIFINKYDKPYEFIYSCFDFKNIVHVEKNDDDIIRFIYVGTVDKVREFDKIFKAFDGIKQKNWSLDFYTRDYEFTKKYKDNMKHNSENVKIFKPLKREDLYQKMALYDVGVSLIPVIDLYNVASPIKLSEYFACKLSVITTAIPEAVELYCGKECAFFTQFDPISITEKLEEIISMKKDKLTQMGENGYKIAKEKRNYEKMSMDLYKFLESVN